MVNTIMDNRNLEKTHMGAVQIILKTVYNLAETFRNESTIFATKKEIESSRKLMIKFGMQ